MRNSYVSIFLFMLLFAGCASTAPEKNPERFAREMIECAHKNLMFGMSFGSYPITQHAANNSNAFLKMATKITNESFVESESPFINEKVQANFDEWLKEVYGENISLKSAWKDYENKCLAKVKPWMKELT